MNTGDTLFYRLPWGIWVETEVSVDTVQLLNGEERKIFYNGFSDYIEGLGGIYFGLQFPLSESLSGGGYEAGCISENGEVLWGAAAGSAYGLYLSESNKLSQEGLRIFPNPASEALMIDMSDIKRIDAIAITDMQGREMMRHSAVRSGAVFDISSLPKGVYILRVTNAEGKSRPKEIYKGRMIKLFSASFSFAQTTTHIHSKLLAG